MKSRRRLKDTNFYIILTDISFSILITFLFLLVTILITTRSEHSVQVPKLRKQIEEMQTQISHLEQDKDRLNRDLGEMAGMGTEAQMEQVLKSVGLGSGTGRKDFNLFIEGLNELPGKDIHLVIDATGSMHGVSNFLIPLLRVIIIRSHKDVSATTWFADGRGESYRGTMGEMFDKLMSGAPFIGNNETIGDAFIRAAANASKPGAYILVGDEPSDDRIYYMDIPSPVFTIPIGRSDPNTKWEYETLAKKTKGKMLELRLE